MSLNDPVQEREVAFRAHVPVGDRPFPIIVYSHGALCSPVKYDGIIRYWASHGYIVVLPMHLDALENVDDGEGNDLEPLNDRIAFS
jgi:predicted dienelactone hydrolase